MSRRSQQVKLPAVLVVLTLLLLATADCKPTEDIMDQTVDGNALSESTNWTLVIRPRSAWGARQARARNPLRASPAPFVVVHHTYIPGACETGQRCEEAMRAMQRAHQDGRGWLDIGYSFAVGGDGLVYEGRGWDVDGAHSPRYNDKSVGVAFIGDFRTILPSAAMLRAARALVSLGVSLGKIRPDHAVLGHRQTRDTECPGQALFDHLATWPAFSAAAPDDPQHFEEFLAARNRQASE